MLKHTIRATTVIFVLFLFLGCWGFYIPDEETISFETRYTVYPELSTVGTEVGIQIHGLRIKNDIIKNLEGYKFRWDLNNDDRFDTEWRDGGNISHVFSAPTTQSVVEVKTPGLDIFRDTCSIYVQPLIKIAGGTTGADCKNADWSMDGSSRLAYESLSGSVIVGQACDQTIWIIEYPGGDPQQVSTNCATFPAWSNDGKHIMFRRGDGVQILDLDTNSERTLFEVAEMVSPAPGWSHNNRDIAYTINNQVGIYRINSQNISTISTNVTYDIICWSPTDEIIAVTSRNNELAHLDFYDVEEGKLSRSIPLKFGYSGSRLDWALNNKWLSIGFANNDNIIYLINLITEQLSEIHITGLADTRHAGWGMDDSMLVFEGRAPGENLSIWAIELPE